ncbi:hypothetical protein HC928_14605 [bacterium]|nr:hypothetical protein [bacterium]
METSSILFDMQRWFSERGGRVVIACQQPLARLFTTVPGVDQVVPENAVPEFQVHASLMSLPQILGTTLETIPNKVPYLYASTDHQLKLEPFPDTRFNVGLVWATGYKVWTDRKETRKLIKHHQTRSCPLSKLEPILSIPEISFYSLQVGHNVTDLAEASGDYLIRDLSPCISDFAGTAVLIDQMDLVISVDTAIIHLAGALGKPVWMMLSRPHDWRWLLEREDTPWYPTMRLFRQPTSGDWDNVIRRVAVALKDMVQGFNAK